MRTLTLFADESGDFDSADEQAFVVAGLLVGGADSRRWLRCPERRTTTPCPTVFGHLWATATLPHLPAAAATPERR